MLYRPTLKAESGELRFFQGMGPQARFVWDGLEFRTPAMLQALEPLSDAAISLGHLCQGLSKTSIDLHIIETLVRLVILIYAMPVPHAAATP